MAGAESINLDNLKDDLTCSVCLEIPRSGVLFQCHSGHAICQSDYKDSGYGSNMYSCHKCRSNHKGYPIRIKLADKFLDLVEISCRHTDKGCSAVMTRKLLKVHEEKCEHGLRPCRFNSNGCKSKVPITDDLRAAEHEENCKFQLYLCVLLSCESSLPHSEMRYHLEQGHNVQFKRSFQHGYGWSCLVSFPVEEALLAPDFKGSKHLTGAAGVFEGKLFYLGLTRAGQMWHVYVCLLDKPSEAKDYLVNISASNPKPSCSPLKYDGPVNPLFAAGEDDCGLSGLYFSNRVAKALTSSEEPTNKKEIRISWSIRK